MDWLIIIYLLFFVSRFLFPLFSFQILSNYLNWIYFLRFWHNLKTHLFILARTYNNILYKIIIDDPLIRHFIKSPALKKISNLFSSFFAIIKTKKPYIIVDIVFIN